MLANLKARAAAGRPKLSYLDECGFSPTLPTGSSWTSPGERKLVEYQAPQGRRVNALAAYRPYRPVAPAGGLRGRADVEVVRPARLPPALPWSKGPRVVVLDIAGL